MVLVVLVVGWLMGTLFLYVVEQAYRSGLNGALTPFAVQDILVFLFDYFQIHREIHQL